MVDQNPPQHFIYPNPPMPLPREHHMFPTEFRIPQYYPNQPNWHMVFPDGQGIISMADNQQFGHAPHHHPRPMYSGSLGPDHPLFFQKTYGAYMPSANAKKKRNPYRLSARVSSGEWNYLTVDEAFAKLNQPLGTRSINTKEVSQKVTELEKMYSKRKIWSSMGLYYTIYTDAIKDPKQYSKMDETDQKVYLRLFNWLSCFNDVEKEAVVYLNDELKREWKKLKNQEKEEEFFGGTI